MRILADLSIFHALIVIGEGEHHELLPGLCQDFPGARPSDPMEKRFPVEGRERLFGLGLHGYSPNAILRCRGEREINPLVGKSLSSLNKYQSEEQVNGSLECPSGHIYVRDTLGLHGGWVSGSPIINHPHPHPPPRLPCQSPLQALHPRLPTGSSPPPSPGCSGQAP
jgi:hypothetical protein